MKEIEITTSITFYSLPKVNDRFQRKLSDP